MKMFQIYTRNFCIFVCAIVSVVNAQFRPETSTKTEQQITTIEETTTAEIIHGTTTEAEGKSCNQIGDRYVKNYIQYECFTADFEKGGFVGKPIDCVDNAGKLIKVDDFFTEKSSNEDSISIECVGDEFLAKKIVHKWSKCLLENGEPLVEGNFVTVDVKSDSLRTPLQKSEIISCLRESDRVILKCTGCVTSSGVHVGITNYINVDGQWTQCRKYKDGCRLINISNDYIDCEYGNKRILNGITFQSESGLSSFYCQNGAIIKKGCVLNGNLVLVGEVRYINDQPLLCEQSDQPTSFNGIVGCDLNNGAFKRFSEVWRVENVMKRCSWKRSRDGIIKGQVVSFACVDGKEIIPLNKVVQRSDGAYFKCSPIRINSTTSSLSSNQLFDDAGLNTFVEDDIELEMRPLIDNELENVDKKKRSKIDLVEYFGVGAKSSQNEFKQHNVKQPRFRPSSTSNADQGCTDLLPFCSRLIGYCNLAQSDLLESGLAIDSSLAEFRDVQSRFEKLIGASTNRTEPSNGCEGQLTAFQKFQVLIEITCSKTCKKCSMTNAKQKERFISDLERTSHCG